MSVASSDRATIVALASAAGGAERGVLRISGPHASRALERSCVRDGEPLRPGPRALIEARFHDLRGTQPCLVLWMPGPRSFTGEDVAELHLPGSPPLLEAALERLVAEGCVHARPGEFTRRAFESGRIDLSRAEAVLALIEAENGAEARAAAALLAGGLERRVEGLREGLLDVRALCEASLDFDSDDTGAVQSSELEGLLAGVAEDLEDLRRREGARTSGSGRPRVVLCGRTNAGKSALYNALTGARALVSPHASTTRDSLRATWSLGGSESERELEVELVDVAGEDLEASAEPDLLARARAHAEQRAADLLLWVVDATREPSELEAELVPLRRGVPVVLAWNQVDRPSAPTEAPAELRARLRASVSTSASEGRGLEALAAAIASALSDAASAKAEGFSGLTLNRRHVDALDQSATELAAAREWITGETQWELAAEHLRLATDALDEITGESGPEDLLDRIFGRFCLGK